MQLSNWNEFKQRIENYSALPPHRREQIIFRGQADHTWNLQATLDRLLMPFKSKENREACSEKLIREFRNALHALPTSPHEQNVMEHAELFKTLVGNYVTPTSPW